MPPGLLDAHKGLGDSGTPSLDLFDPPFDEFSKAFRDATSDHPQVAQFEPMVLARLERRLGKPAADWTADDHRVALRTLGFLVDRAYESQLPSGLSLRAKSPQAPAPRRRGAPRKWRGPDLTKMAPEDLLAYLTASMGRSTVARPVGGLLFPSRNRGGRPKKGRKADEELIARVESEKRAPNESDRAAIVRLVQAELAAHGRGAYRLPRAVSRIASQLSRARRRVADTAG